MNISDGTTGVITGAYGGSLSATANGTFTNTNQDNSKEGGAGIGGNMRSKCGDIYI
jgi:hypothetical protein